MKTEWTGDFKITVKSANGETVVSANRDGLLSLANQIAALADEESGSHIHYDEFNSLEEDSDSLIIEKIL